jgi:hypothetical protein|tara:strand:- start:41 stop:346 length:306 start_codon:yes stop_codon:yes gene_type:complete
MSVIAPGSDWDVRGCIASAGYTWCDILGKCIRLWEESCKYPENCLGWYDGCNTCNIINGELGACTMMMCFQQEIPECSVWTPDVVIDPLPPLINPFIGDGH